MVAIFCWQRIMNGSRLWTWINACTVIFLKCLVFDPNCRSTCYHRNTIPETFKDWTAMPKLPIALFRWIFFRKLRMHVKDPWSIVPTLGNFFYLYWASLPLESHEVFQIPFLAGGQWYVGSPSAFKIHKEREGIGEMMQAFGNQRFFLGCHSVHHAPFLELQTK